jgi:hypothetical protein
MIGLLSLVWFAIRTGTKPSRAVYPCQQVAAVNGYTWLAACVFPLFFKVRRSTVKPHIRRNIAFITLAALAIIACGVLVNRISEDYTSLASTNQPAKLSLSGRLAQLGPASDIFVLEGTSGNDQGVAELIDLMGNHTSLFYESTIAGNNKGPTGIIASDDTIIIKVNSQWDERGGTNTDLLKALIEAIVQHPDGFAGEIVVADNGQAQYGPTGQGGSLNYGRNNAEDISQSVQKVIDSFAISYKVSTYLWDTITTQRVEEYSEGDTADGYVINTTINPTTGAMISYPKFKTEFGTYVSFKLGLWNPQKQSYDSDRLKVINVPVLKSHMIYGVTACVKHYMGVVSDQLTTGLGARAHDTVATGGMGTQMVGTRLPVLNIIDAIWVNANPMRGPGTSYRSATRTNVIATSTDPVALDYWTAKHILLPAAQNEGYTDTSSMDPDNVSIRSFGQWLRLSMQEINQAGYQATVDEARMNVYVSQLQSPPPPVTPPGSPESEPFPFECFIATAAYGTPMAEEIQILREFRDEYLLTSPVGQALVDFYYRVSPPIAEFITEHRSLKPIVRVGLMPAVVMSTVVVNTTPAEKMAIVGLLVLLSMALAVWAKRRRGRGLQYA